MLKHLCSKYFWLFFVARKGHILVREKRKRDGGAGKRVLEQLLKCAKYPCLQYICTRRGGYEVDRGLLVLRTTEYKRCAVFMEFNKTPWLWGAKLSYAFSLAYLHPFAVVPGYITIDSK